MGSFDGCNRNLGLAVEISDGELPKSGTGRILKKKLRENKNDISDNVKLTESLKKVRGFLEELKESL